MWFKNLQIYRLASGWNFTAGQLEEKLALRVLQPCAGMSMQSRGWVSPRADAQLVYSQERHLLVAIGHEQKLLPASVINQDMQERAVELEARQGYKPGRKQLRDLKDRVTSELLPRAFARRRITRAWINQQAGWLVIDTTVPARAEDLLTLLRETLGEFPATLVEFEQSARSAMTAWLNAGDAPGAFSLHEDCELKAADDSGAAVRYVRHGLDGKDIRAHIAGGKSVTRLGLTWGDRLALVLTEDAMIRRLRFLGIEGSRDEGSSLSPDDEYDANFALMAGALEPLLADWVQALGGEKSLSLARAA
jgi:recombination associated protein RdgC